MLLCVLLSTFFPLKVLEIPRGGYYTILQLGKGMWPRLCSVQAPSLATVSILKLLQETSSYLKIKSSAWDIN